MRKIWPFDSSLLGNRSFQKYDKCEKRIIYLAFLFHFFLFFFFFLFFCFVTFCFCFFLFSLIKIN